MAKEHIKVRLKRAIQTLEQAAINDYEAGCGDPAEQNIIAGRRNKAWTVINKMLEEIK